METLILVLGCISMTGIVCHAYTARDRYEHKRRMRELEGVREQWLLAERGDDR